MKKPDADLRSIPSWERSERVLSEAAELEPGEAWAFLTEIDPRALIGLIEQQKPRQLLIEPRRRGKRDWHVTLTRVAPSNGSSLAVALRRSPIFAVLEDEDRAAIEALSTERAFRKGNLVYAENEAFACAGIVIEGSIGIFLGAGNRESLILQAEPGDAFALLETIDGGRTVGRAQVLSKTARACVIPRSAIQAMASREPQFLSAIASTVAQQARSFATTLASQVSQPILRRVAGALLPYASPERGLHDALPPLPVMTQSQVAAAAGTVKEVAARTIAQLERDGALKREHGHIRFLDRQKLLNLLGD